MYKHSLCTLLLIGKRTKSCVYYEWQLGKQFLCKLTQASFHDVEYTCMPCPDGSGERKKEEEKKKIEIKPQQSPKSVRKQAP